VGNSFYGGHPTYFVYAGLVFMPLNRNYMDIWDWKDQSARFRHYADHLMPSAERRQVVIINQVLPHDVNIGYHKLQQVVVERVNGRPVFGLADVINALGDPQGPRHVIEIDNHAGSGARSNYYDEPATRVVLDAAAAAPYKTGDSLLLSVPSQSVKAHLPLGPGKAVLLYGGRHIGHHGTVDALEGDTITLTTAHGRIQTKKAFALALP